MPNEPLDRWLATSDPALRWQVERDVLGASPEVWESTRRRVATEGFGVRLLAEQDADGQWAGGAFFPADYDGTEAGQPWTATTWTLNTLREWGLDASVLQRRRTAESLAEHSRWEYDGSPYWSGEADCCINAWTVANGGWLGVDVAANVNWFVEHQLPDGGWNCEWVNASRRSSFHSTLNSLKGLLADEMTTGGTDDSRAARRRGQEYLLERHLVHRLSTNELVAAWISEFRYPMRWSYSALNACDYFRAAAQYDGVAPDPRMSRAVDIVRDARQADGTWLQTGRHPGRVWFEVDVPADQPSKWLTFTGTRLLSWWDSATAP